jgi:hypothetical protein
LPDEESGSVNGLEESKKPAIKRKTFDRKKGESSASKAENGGERIFDKEGQRGLESNPGENEATNKFTKLFDGHGADETKLVTGDVLGDRMMLHDYCLIKIN